MAHIMAAIALYIVAGLSAAGGVVFLIATFRVADKDDWSAMFLGLAIVVGFAIVFLFSLSGALALSCGAPNLVYPDCIRFTPIKRPCK